MLMEEAPLALLQVPVGAARVPVPQDRAQLGFQEANWGRQRHVCGTKGSGKRAGVRGGTHLCSWVRGQRGQGQWGPAGCQLRPYLVLTVDLGP